MNRGVLSDILDSFKDRKVAVVGDFYLDRYVHGVMEDISREAAVPIVRFRKGGNIYSPGAAGNTAWNLSDLGAEVYAVGVIGDDYAGKILIQELSLRDIDTGYLVVDPMRITCTYEKTYAKSKYVKTGEWQQVARLDAENDERIGEETTRRLTGGVKALLDKVDAVVVVDQVEEEDKGTVTREVLEELKRMARSSGKLFVADSRKRIGRFDGFSLIVPNDYEAAEAAGVEEIYWRDEIGDEEIIRAGLTLRERLGCDVVVTRGERGMTAFKRSGEIANIPTVPAEGELDITGAGDTVTAAITLSLCSGAELIQAAMIGNLAARVTVKKVGITGTASKDEILSEFDQIKDSLGEVVYVRA
jgi:rfaE bifunctional protein kinase chain/domain